MPKAPIPPKGPTAAGKATMPHGKPKTPGKPNVGGLVGDATNNMASNSNNKMARTAAAIVNTAKQLTQAVTRMVKGVAHVVKLFASPHFWIAVVAIIVIIVIIVVTTSFKQTVGYNENFCPVNEQRTSLAEFGTKGSDEDIESARNSIGGWLMGNNFKFLGDKPMSKEQTAAVLGNLQLESSFDPANVNSIGATGLAQWLGGRKTDLESYASSQGKQITDATVQLEWLRKELDEKGYGDRLLGRGFNDEGKSVDELATIFENVYEGSGEQGMDKRKQYANEAYETLKPTKTSGGGACKFKNGGANMSSVVDLAISISYPTTKESRVDPGDPRGVNKAPAAYKEAKAKAEEKGGKDPYQGGPLYASCDRFVATVIKNTVDPNFPWGPTSDQYDYLNNRATDKWQKYTKKSEAKPGDIWVTTGNGHIILYIGEYNGQDSIAHASHLERVGGIGSASYLDDNLKDTDNRQYAGFHFIG